ncbi:MAG: class I SAM-dependent methyltransferase [Smithellaceae bacterium]
MSRIGDLFFLRKHHVCPRWLCFTFDNWIRRRIQDPDRIIKAYIRAGDTVLDIGPGIGFFTIPMARLVGDGGQVIAVDIQEAMLTAISKRALGAGVAHRIKTQLASPVSLNISVPSDFILAFWMAHEVPDQEKLFTQLYAALKDEGKFLLAEPRLHVSKAQFDMAVSLAQNVGFKLLDRPSVALSLAALFVRQ